MTIRRSCCCPDFDVGCTQHRTTPSGEDPSEPDENEPHQSGQEGHKRGTLPASPMPETHGITGRTNIRHAQARDAMAPVTLKIDEGLDAAGDRLSGAEDA